MLRFCRVIVFHGYVCKERGGPSCWNPYTYFLKQPILIHKAAKMTQEKTYIPLPNYSIIHTHDNPGPCHFGPISNKKHANASSLPRPILEKNRLVRFTRMQPVQIDRRHLLERSSLAVADFVVESQQEGGNDDVLFQFGKLVEE